MQLETTFAADRKTAQHGAPRGVQNAHFPSGKGYEWCDFPDLIETRA